MSRAGSKEASRTGDENHLSVEKPASRALSHRSKASAKAESVKPKKNEETPKDDSDSDEMNLDLMALGGGNKGGMSEEEKQEFLDKFQALSDGLAEAQKQIEEILGQQTKDFKAIEEIREELTNTQKDQREDDRNIKRLKTSIDKLEAKVLERDDNTQEAGLKVDASELESRLEEITTTLQANKEGVKDL